MTIEQERLRRALVKAWVLAGVGMVFPVGWSWVYKDPHAPALWGSAITGMWSCN